MNWPEAFRQVGIAFAIALAIRAVFKSNSDGDSVHSYSLVCKSCDLVVPVYLSTLEPQQGIHWDTKE